MNIGNLYPVLDFSTVDHRKIPEHAYLVAFDKSNPGILCRVDSSGIVTPIGVNRSFFQPGEPTDPMLGDVWFDTKLCETFTRLNDGLSDWWVSTSNSKNETFSDLLNRSFTFPKEPALNDKFIPYEDSQISYIWTGYAWKIQSEAFTKTFYFQDEEPTGFIDEGVFWYKPSDLVMYVRAYDGENYHWIETYN